MTQVSIHHKTICLLICFQMLSALGIGLGMNQKHWGVDYSGRLRARILLCLVFFQMAVAWHAHQPFRYRGSKDAPCAWWCLRQACLMETCNQNSGFFPCSSSEKYDFSFLHQWVQIGLCSWHVALRLHSVLPTRRRQKHLRCQAVSCHPFVQLPDNCKEW